MANRNFHERQTTSPKVGITGPRIAAKMRRVQAKLAAERAEMLARMTARRRATAP